jgi:hypothetical protein
MSHTGFFVCHQVVKIRQKTAGSSLNTFMYLNPYIIKNKSISVIDMVCPNQWYEELFQGCIQEFGFWVDEVKWNRLLGKRGK